MTSTDTLTSSATKDTKLESKQTTHGASPTVTLNTRVGARKGKEISNGSNDSRNSELKKKCTYCRKPNHEEHKCCKKKADKTAAAEKEQSDAEHTADATVKVARTEKTSDSASSSHNEERIRQFTARQPAIRRTPAHHWLIDSGASAPMTVHHDLFVVYRTFGSPQHVWLGDERCIYAVGAGQIALDIPSDRTTSRLIVQGVLHVPSLQDSLLSVSNLVRHGYFLTFDSDGCAIRSTASGAPIARAHTEDNLYTLNAAPFIHYPRIRAEYRCIDELDGQCHQLNPAAIECTLFGLASIQSASTCVPNLTNRVYKLRDTIITFSKDFTSTPEWICLKTNSFILQDFKTFMPWLTASNKAFHMPKDPSKATVEDPPYKDYPPSEPGHRSTHTGESTHISSSQAAPSLMSSWRLTWPHMTPICDDDARVKTCSYGRRSMHNPWIQWAALIPTLPYMIWILSDCHIVVKWTFFHGELKDNTFVRFPTDFSHPDNKVLHLDKVLHGLNLAKMASDIGIDDHSFHVSLSGRVRNHYFDVQCDWKNTFYYHICLLNQYGNHTVPLSYSSASHSLLRLKGKTSYLYLCTYYLHVP
jgi:hypothetical protein